MLHGKQDSIRNRNPSKNDLGKEKTFNMAAQSVSTPMFSKQIPVFGLCGILCTSKVIATFLMLQSHHLATLPSNRLQSSSKPGLV